MHLNYVTNQALSMNNKNTTYRVVFEQNDTIVELYAKYVSEAEHLFGFIVVEDFLFGEKSSVVVDPSEERLKTIFQEVKRTYIPLTEVIRIDEVEKQGACKITPLPKGGSKVANFPPIRNKPGD